MLERYSYNEEDLVDLGGFLGLQDHQYPVDDFGFYLYFQDDNNLTVQVIATDGGEVELKLITDEDKAFHKDQPS